MATEQYIVEESLVDEEIDQIANEIAQELENELDEGMQDKLNQKPGGGKTGEAPEQAQVGKTKELKGNKLTKKKVKAEVKTKGQGSDPAEIEVYEQDEEGENGNGKNGNGKNGKKKKNPFAKKNGDEDEEDVEETFMPQTKQEIIRSIFETLKNTDGDKLAGAYAKLMSTLLGEESDEDEDEDENGKNGKKGKNPFAKKVVTSEDIDITEDLTAIFGDNKDELSEEFKSQVQTIFEAAVVAKINSELETFENSFAAQLEESKQEIHSAITDKVDTYLSYVVEEWIKENELAIDRGIKAEITEEFIGGLKQLFEDHYIDVPEEKVDVVDSLADRVEELESKLNEQIDTNVNLATQVKGFQKSEILGNISSELTDIEADKLKGLSDGVGFEDADQYKTSLETIKENYFPHSNQNRHVVIDEESEVLVESGETASPPSGAMASYVKLIGKSRS